MRRSVGSAIWSVLAFVVAGVAIEGAAGPVPLADASAPGTLVAGVDTPTNVAQLTGLTGHLAADTGGHTYVTTGARIWRVDASTGALTLVAGTGELGTTGDGGPATAATLTFPTALAVGPDGSVYFFDSYRIRKVTPGGTISTIAGTGTPGIGSDVMPAVGQPIVDVASIAVDSNHNVYFTQSVTSFVGIRKVSSTTGDLLDAAGGFPATSTCSGLSGPPGSMVLGNGSLQVAVDRTFDEIYVSGSCSIGGFVSRITAGTATWIAGGGATAPTAGLNARSALLPSYLTDVGLLAAGELHLAALGQLWRISAGELQPVAGTSGTCLFADGVAAANVCVSSFAMSTGGRIDVVFTGRLGRLAPATLDDRTAAPSAPDGVGATTVGLPNLYDLAVRNDGEVYLTAGTTSYLRTVTTAGILATKAGAGDPLATPTFGGAAVGSAIGYQQLALDTDAAGNLYLVVNSEYVAKVTTTGSFVKLAGTGVWGNGPDGPSAVTTAVAPIAVAATADGATVYVLGNAMSVCGGYPCSSGQVIRRIDASGAIGTVWTSAAGAYPYRDLAVAPDGTVVLLTPSGDLARLTPGTGAITAIPFADGGMRSTVRVDDLGTIYVGTDDAIVTTGPNGGALTTAYAYRTPMQAMTMDVAATGALYVLHDDTVRVVAQAPGAPTNLAVARGATTTTATWSAPVRTGGTTITGYRLEHSADGGATWTTAATTTASPAVIGALGPGAHLFRVVATNAVGAGPASAAVGTVEAPTEAELQLLPGGLVVSDSTPAVGQQLTLTADGFAPDEWVAVVLQSTPTLIGTVRADGTGAVHAALVVPAGIAAGAHVLSLVGDTSGAGFTAAVTVVALDDGLAQPTPPPATFTARSPVRLFETRPGEPAGVVPVPVGRVGGASVLRVKVTGVAGVPSSGVGAVSLNVTAVDPVADGFVTVWPCGDRPLAANVNFVAGEIVPNAVIAPVSASGEVCFYAYADTFLVADINGWFAADAGFAALPPVRLFETRPTDPQGVVPVVQQRYGGASVLRVKVTGVAGVPSSGVGAVSLNVTAVDPVADGFVTVWPCGDRPLAANVNFVAGEIVPNAVIAPVSASGEVCFYAYADTFLVADINGWFAADAGFAALPPVRLFETRPTDPQGVVPVVQQRYGGANVLRVKVTGVAGVPSSGVGAVSLNVTAVDPVADGFVTVWPCGDRPLAANVNFVAGEIVPNAVIAPVSASGEVCFYAYADTFLVADINGWFETHG